MKEYTCLIGEGLVCPACHEKNMGLYTFISTSATGRWWRSDWHVCTCGHINVVYVNANGHDDMTNRWAFIPYSHRKAVVSLRRGEEPDGWKYTLRQNL